MACISTALMVGGGIAGLATAVGLARLGVQCEVVEIAHDSLGASLGISGRAMDALKELGVFDVCYAESAHFTSENPASNLMDSTGRLLSGNLRSKLGPAPEGLVGIGVYRPALLQRLADAAEKLGVTIRNGMSIEAIQEAAGRAMVTFSDGEKRQFDLVVGTDGIGSRTRKLLFPNAAQPAYAGQISIRWMAPGPAIEGEGWYLGPIGRIGGYAMPQNFVYVPAVVNRPEWKRMTDEELFSLYTDLLDSYTAPFMVELRRRFTPEAKLICRPFEWHLMPDPWYQGRTILIGDAAHATSAHMGYGGGLALEDAVVLAQCIGDAEDLHDAFKVFMQRRFERVRMVVETSIALSRLEQENAPPSENIAVATPAFAAIAKPY